MIAQMRDPNVQATAAIPFGTRRADPLPAQRGPQGTPRRSGGNHVDVLLVDPDADTVRAMRSALMGAGVAQVIAVGSPSEVTDLLARGLTADLALISLALGAQAPAVITGLRAAGWDRILALSPAAEIGPVIDAVSAGVSGIVIERRANPGSRNVPSTIQDLTGREIEIIRLVADGRSNKWIGERLDLSALTVKSHLARIGRKLGTGDRAHMVTLALRAGVIN